MKTRLLLAAVLALGASAAHAANPSFEIRAGAVDLGALGSTTYTGIGGRYRIDDTWAVYGDYDFTISSTGVGDARFNRIGGGVEVGFGDDEMRVNFRIGVVYTDAEVLGVPVTDTAASYGVDFRFKRLGLGYSVSEFNGQTMSSTSFSVYF